MPVLGVIACEIIELELAWLLAKDPHVGGVTVLEDARSARLIEALESRGVPNLHRIPHVNSLSREPSHCLSVVVRVLELALHRNRRALQGALYHSARELAPHTDALFLGYGLCGNALSDPTELLDVGKPVFVPMDGEHPVDDCIGMLLGGRRYYYAEQRKVPGTFFMTPGWTHHWRRVFENGQPEARNPQPETHLKRMFARYERSLIVPTPAMSEDEMKRNVEDFNEHLSLRMEVHQGTMTILNKAWESAGAFLRENAGNRHSRE